MTASAITVLNARAPVNDIKTCSDGTQYEIQGNWHGTDSYATGGDAADFKAFGGVLGATQPTRIVFFPQNGYTAQWDSSAKKVKIYVSGGVEVTSTTDVHAISFPYIAYYPIV